eukprot:3513288-Prymnesium_polylepis.2
MQPSAYKGPVLRVKDYVGQDSEEVRDGTQRQEYRPAVSLVGAAEQSVHERIEQPRHEEGATDRPRRIIRAVG